MSYRNINQILPPEVVELIQGYVEGEYVYIPRKSEHKREWGAQTGAKQQTAERNLKIYQEHLQGKTNARLAQQYYLSVKSIQRILYEQKSQS